MYLISYCAYIFILIMFRVNFHLVIKKKEEKWVKSKSTLLEKTEKKLMQRKQK